MDTSTVFTNINWLSVVIATISAFIIGGIWYGPVFGQAWMVAFGLSEEKLKQRSAGRTFGVAFVLTFIAAVNLEMFIGAEANFGFGAMAGFFAGLGWVSTFLGILYVFEMKSLRAFGINAGYCTLALTTMGAILGAM